MMRTAVQGPEWLLRKGLKDELNGRNWRRLAAKLATPGSNITVVVFGGSASTGFGLQLRNANWVSQFCSWLQSAFINTNIIQVNLARDATNVPMAETCWYHHTPPEADLVLIEYNLNSCSYFNCFSVVTPQIIAYESLIRRLIRKVPNAALLAFDMFSFDTFDVATPNNNGTRQIPAPYYNSGEEVHSMLATRYNMPLISARDALYDIMWSDKALTRILNATRKDLLRDTRHPTIMGHALYGRGLVAWGVRQTLALELQALAADGAAATPNEAVPRPVSPLVAQIDGDSWCAEGRDLQSYVVASSSGSSGAADTGVISGNNTSEAGAVVPTNGTMIVNATASKQAVVDWQLEELTFTRGCKLPNCQSIGMQARGRGSTLDLQLDLSAAKSPSGTLNRRAITVFFMSGVIHLPGEKGTVGQAQLSCESGCTCRPMLLEGARGDTKATVATNSTEVLGGPACTVRITIKDNDWVRVQALAVVPYTNAIMHTLVDVGAIGLKYSDGTTPPLGHRRRLQGQQLPAAATA
uniref:SGNH hydrolase-type esterase domain-containing protein n=1 Tax=Tetradesmus obliquus TaxID=3088 RepID=A0A383W6I2_TETOB|eukprot:jgi/Sobl393_1/2629/SZX73061.1